MKDKNKRNQNKENNFFKTSKIIRYDERELIFNWLSKKPIDIKLILDSNIDDDSLTTFIKKCENSSPIILFIKTKENLRFGGFCNETWPKSGWKRDSRSFIFSLDRKEIYRVNKPDHAIGSCESFINFGNDGDGFWDLVIHDHYLKNGGETWKHIYQLPDNNLINNGKNQFLINNLEIYQLYF